MNWSTLVLSIFLGLFSLAAVAGIIGAVIGVAYVVQNYIGPGWALIMFGGGGLLAACTAFWYSELGGGR
jgi:hypothetical protein